MLLLIIIINFNKQKLHFINLFQYFFFINFLTSLTSCKCLLTEFLHRGQHTQDNNILIWPCNVLIRRAMIVFVYKPIFCVKLSHLVTPTW